MTYVFIFTGEFGYELLNWNGVVRKWAQQHKQNGDTIVVCSRHGLESIYEMADYYIDVSDIDAYKNSIADCYCSFVRDGNGKIDRHGYHETAILETIKATIDEAGFKDVRYIYSPVLNVLNGCVFGRGGIYGPEREVMGQLDVTNNKYTKFLPKDELYADIESKLGFTLDTPFVLCQRGSRDIVRRDKVRLEVDDFISSISKKYPVVCLSFGTSKKLDSSSTFDDTQMDNVYYYNTDSLEEQACLITKSHRCIFFSEGDFRSHMYVPPFYGKSVTAVATYDVFHNISAFPGRSNAPVKFWNEHVWPFSRGIEPLYYEDLIRDHDHGYQNILNTLGL